MSRAVSRSVDVCDVIRKGKDDATALKSAAFRYDVGNAGVEAEATETVSVTQVTYRTSCRTS
ncbi:hypothetical protein AB0P17_11600 [Streptomyces sp. NPDC088124]|uniref:hypothetical protein n=1 Tax=Streptomyces sp. NPDC088124 TaxID=3154654 RepID=UPI003441237F